jgi:hypothetical protein
MIKRKLNGAKKLNGPNCDFEAAKVYAITMAAGGVLAPTLAQDLSQKEFNKCRCRNNAEYYRDNNSWAQYGGNSAVIYSWAYDACTKEPMRTIGSSANENSYLYYVEYINQTTQAPVTPGGGGGAVIPGSTTTTTTTTQPQTKAQSFILPALLGAAILLLPFP